MLLCSQAPQSLAATGLFSVSVKFAFSSYHINGITQYWLLSLRTVHFKFTHVVNVSSSSLLLLSSIPLHGSTRVWCSIHQLEDIWIVSSFLQS